MKKFFLLPILAAGLLGACNSDKQNTQQAQATTASDEYKLVWSDEFDYNGLPAKEKWGYDTVGNAWGWGNHELQHYTVARPENVNVSEGTLKITARKEQWQDKQYTSTRLITKDKGDWLYGKVEVKARLPKGRGLWPAIWMLPTDWKYGGWPASGEIDIMEHVGYEPDSIYASAHTQSYHHSIGTNKTEIIKVDESIYTDFHIYTLEWEKDQYSILMDGEKFFTFKNEGTGPDEWPFDQRFHLLLNVAVGGDWGGKHGIDESVFPATMEVDYVRVYQKPEKIKS